MGNQIQKCPKCEEPIPKGSPLKACPNHVCEHVGCLESQRGTSTWGCRVHACWHCDKPFGPEHDHSKCKCTWCDSTKPPGYAHDVCVRCKCAVENCYNHRRQGTYGWRYKKYSFCDEHCCSHKTNYPHYCNNRSVDGTNLCEKHKCIRCDNPVTRDWNICKKHLKVHLETIRKENEQRIERRKLLWSKECPVCLDYINDANHMTCMSCKKTILHAPQCVPKDYRCPICRDTLYGEPYEETTVVTQTKRNYDTPDDILIHEDTRDK